MIRSFGDCTGEITGIGTLTKAQGRQIGFIGIEQIGRELGGFTQTQGQYAGRKRIKGAGMAALVGGKETAAPLQSLVRR